MLHIRILGAQDLPLLPDKLKKTRISCFSYSSYRYYYGTFKSSEKTTEPTFDATIDVDLFRAIGLTFVLHTTQSMQPVNFIGNVNIELPRFLTVGTGKRLLETPNKSFNFKFPIKSGVSENPFLLFQLTYVPKEYPPITVDQFKELPIVHLWATYDPPVANNATNPVEIELLQAYPVADPRPKIKTGYYFHLDKRYNWESVGKSSMDKSIIGATGMTQIHSFSLPKIQSKYNFLILNVANYKGTIKLNFVGEQKGKIANIENSNYINLQGEEIQAGTIRTVDIQVEPNTKYSAPIILFYDKVKGKTVFAINGFPPVQNRYKSDENLEEPDQTLTDFEFHSKIIEEATKVVPAWNDIIFKRTNVLPKTDPVSIAKTFEYYHLPKDLNIRLYLGSSIAYNGGSTNQTDVWTPSFVVYDKNTGKQCPDIGKELTLRPSLEFPTNFFAKSFLHFKFNSFINLDFTKFDKNKVFIFAMGCSATTKSIPHGIYLISHNDGENETLMFRNLISAGSPKVHFVVCFRFECINDDWQIIPMRHYFKDNQKMLQTLDAMFLNKWNLPLSQTSSQINNTFLSESSDDEPLNKSKK
ncbi:hypothetical protein M9Y10_014745 [Tritrichomonas musculus]|uniref:C2 domain-containing protein n=1 Tax=Tritrichomonas musculus TaxID=1915356 RepID=A0ABR2L0G7_9EUKA